MAVIAKENGYFFNSDNGDRLYSADSFDSVFNTFFTNGVAPGSLAVTATNPASMSVKVAPGYAHINGKQARFEEESLLTFTPLTGSGSRRDIVVVRRNDTTRTISLDVVMGEPASSPVAPTPVREGGIYELVLAEVRIFSGSSTIVNGSIYDRRSSSSVCGIIGVPNETYLNEPNAGYHNSIYRGMSLGTYVTTEQLNQISAGTFENLFVGDYWTINGNIYRIAGFDYWRTTNQVVRSHVVIVPDNSIIAGARMNSAAVTTGAYLGSNFYTGNGNNTARASAQSIITTAFGSNHLLQYNEYLANAVSSGAESGTALTAITIEMMSEVMVYGSNILHYYTRGTNVGQTFSASQLPLFRHRPDLIRCENGNSYWLRDVANATSFACVKKDGSASLAEANDNTNFGFRPVFAIRAS